MIKNKIPRVNREFYKSVVGFTGIVTGVLSSGYTYQDFYVDGSWQASDNLVARFLKIPSENTKFWGYIYKYYDSIGDTECAQEAMCQILGSSE